MGSDDAKPRGGKKRIGIVGGVGPAGGVAMLEAIYRAARARTVEGRLPNDGYPAIVLASVPAPPSLMASDDSDRSFPPIAAAARELTAMGCSVMALACVTMHQALDRIEKHAGGKWISLVDAAVREVAVCGVKRVAVLSTDTARATGLFDAPLAASGVEEVPLTPKEQGMLDDIVRDLVELGASSRAPSALVALSEAVASRGAQAIVVGCTDLSALTGSWSSAIRCIDAVDSAAHAVLEAAASAG